MAPKRNEQHLPHEISKVHVQNKLFSDSERVANTTHAGDDNVNEDENEDYDERNITLYRKTKEKKHETKHY